LIFQVDGEISGGGLGLFFQLDGDLGEAGAEGLAAFEFVEGAVEGVFDADLEQGEVVEGLGGVGVAAGNVGGAEVRGEGLEALVVLLEGVGAEVVVVGFALAEAAEAPPGVGDAVDQEALVGAGGLEVVFEGAEGFLEGGGILAGEDGEAGGEAVLEGVEADGGLALGGARSGGKQSVTPIGVDATRIGHSRSPFTSYLHYNRRMYGFRGAWEVSD
jgi:hypothetical protein